MFVEGEYVVVYLLVCEGFVVVGVGGLGDFVFVMWEL